MISVSLVSSYALDQLESVSSSQNTWQVVQIMKAEEKEDMNMTLTLHYIWLKLAIKFKDDCRNNF